MLEHALAEIIGAVGPDYPDAIGARLELDYQRLLVGRTAGLERDLEHLVDLATRPGERGTWLAFAWEILGRVRVATGRARQAEPLLREAVERRQKERAGVYNLAMAEEALAECLERQNRMPEAGPLYQSAYDRLWKLLGPDAYSTRQAAEHVR